jgi:phospholipid/cholesterol/gamma-HCH transport system substrate-binding protein
MKTTSEQKIKIGGFVIAGIIVLLLGVFLIGNQKNMFNSTFSVYGIFNNVNGLQVGNNVRFAGINIGVVDGIDIVTDSSVKVTVTLNEKVKKFIKKDARMSIGSDGLMGDKLVAISPGAGNGQAINDGSRLGVVNPVDMDKVISKLTKIADNGATLAENLSDIVEKINHGQGSIGRLLNNDKMAKDIESTVNQAKSTIKTVHKTSATLNEDLKAAQHNFLLKGFFKKKQKAKEDSLKKIQEQQKKLKEQ